MIRKLVTTATFCVLLSGCGAAATNTWSSPEERWTEPSVVASKKPAKMPAKADAEAKPVAPARAVGDFMVQRYSGSFRKNPLTVTEEVIARDGDLLIVDHTFEEGERTLQFRTRVDLKSNQVVAVSKIEDGIETEMTLAAYEAVMSETVFAADTNEERLGAEPATCLVGGETHDCEITSYRVTIGGKPAKLSVSTSKTLPDRDVAGEITAEDGSVIYRAEIVEIGNGKPSSAVASAN
jgi:hypothetical protein